MDSRNYQLRAYLSSPFFFHFFFSFSFLSYLINRTSCSVCLFWTSVFSSTEIKTDSTLETTWFRTNLSPILPGHHRLSYSTIPMSFEDIFDRLHPGLFTSFPNWFVSNLHREKIVIKWKKKLILNINRSHQFRDSYLRYNPSLVSSSLINKTCRFGSSREKKKIEK